MFRRRKLKDFSEELQAHLALETDQLREDGFDEREARRLAHLNLGNLMNQEERYYEASPFAWLDQLRQDVRYSLRQLRNSPGFTLTAALTLALGVGATTAIFSLIHAVLLKSLPVARPEQLYTIGEAKHVGVNSGMEEEWDIFSHDLYQSLRDHTSSFEELAAFQADPRRVGVRRIGTVDPAEPFIAEYVSGNYFSTFGLHAIAGRSLNPDDDRQGGPPMGMIAYRVWQQKYALDPSVIGSSFQINGAAVMIVGATPPGFFGDALRSNPPDFFLPLAIEPVVNHAGWVNNPDLHWLYLMGRIKPGAEVRTTEAQMQVLLRQWLTQREHFGARGRRTNSEADVASEARRIRHWPDARDILDGTQAADGDLRFCAADRLRQPGELDASSRVGTAAPIFDQLGSGRSAVQTGAAGPDRECNACAPRWNCWRGCRICGNTHAAEHGVHRSESCSNRCDPGSSRPLLRFRGRVGDRPHVWSGSRLDRKSL